MSVRSTPRLLTLVLAGAILLGVSDLAAQDTARRSLTPADYGKWESLAFASQISPDGRWLAYPVDRVNEENELRITPLDRDTTLVVPYAQSPRFSRDGRWLAYAIGVSAKERARLEKEKKPIHMRLGLRNLVTGDTLSVADVAGFTFSDDSRYLTMRRYAPEGAGSRKQRGVDLVVRDLAAGSETNFGNVAEYAWQPKGGLVAMLIDAEGQAGNGVELFDPGSGRLRLLESKNARYEGLTWREDDDDLAVMRLRADDKRYKDSTYVVLAWRDVAGNRQAAFAFDPDSTPGFPADMRVVTYAGIRWSDDARTLYFGIKERERAKQEAKDSTATKDSTAARDTAKAPRDTAGARADRKPAADEPDEPSTVQIWNAKDVDIYPEQKVRANQDRRRNHLIAWHLDDARFVRLGTELTEDVTLAKGDRWAIGTDRTPYERDGMFGPDYQDLYRIDVATGDATLIMQKVQYTYGPSSAGRYLLYLMKDHYWTYDLATGKHTNVTAGLATTFVNVKDDHPVEQKPPFGTGGWTKDDRSVLLYDEYDVWEARPDGSGTKRLTVGMTDSTRYRRVRLDPDEKYVDLAKPVYLSTTGDWSKRSGYSRLAGGKVERLVWEDASIGRLSKARDAEVYLYVAQDFNRSPNFFVAGPTLASARQVSHTNPFQREYRWGRSELIEYRNDWGERLQGALFYPADYEPGKRYPMIVYIYEIRSPSVHQYVVPSSRAAYDPTVWTSQGYFVLQPDIVYRDRDPGRSAVAAIVPAVKRVLETGMVDPKQVGLTGHSWGGYQTAFVVTQTDIFAAAVAGAPLTDLVSMYLSVYWNSGGTDARIFEISQGRMAVPFWDDIDAYIANSPVFHVERLHTPLLVAQGTEDGAVDFNQGVEYYNAARRAGKDFVFLVYEGENHSNAKKANQIDYHNRILEWFAHYLKGEPAPDWITKGVSYLDQEQARKKDAKTGAP